MTSVGLDPIFSSYGIVVAAIFGLLASLAVRPNFSSVSPRRQRVLFLLRGAAVLLIALGMVRPSLIHTGMREDNGTVAVVLDASRSMSVDDMQNETRWNAARKAITTAFPQMRFASFPTTPIRTFVFSESVRNVPATGGAWDFPEVPTGNQTDLGSALDGVLRAHASSSLAAVVLLSDGAQRTLRPGVPLTQPAHELGRRGIPLITVSFGRTRDQSQTRDIIVESMPDALESFVKNEVILRAMLREQGFAKTAIPVQLTVESPNGEKEVIGPIAVRSDADQGQIPVEFVVNPLLAGEYRLTLEVPIQEGEQLTDNNQLQAFLDVREGGLRVLFLDGNVGWQEQRYIRRALDGAPEIDLDYNWLDARKKAEWPIEASEIFQKQLYDVTLLADVHSQALGDESGKFLAERINQGMGLMMLGGVNSFGGGGYGKNPLGEALPVRLSATDERAVNASLDEVLHYKKDILVSQVSPHFVTRIEQAGVSWQELPAFQGANRLIPTGIGELLIQGDGGESILVAGQYGSGRTLAFAGDSTYRWYRRGFEEFHQRFWRQSILWLARKDNLENDSVWIKLPRRRVIAGAQMDFETGFRSTTIPPDEIQLDAVLVLPGGSRMPIPLANASSAHLLARTGVLSQPGEYRLQVVAQRSGQELDRAELGFWVIKQDLELSDAAANPEQLAYLSSLTEASGGTMVVPEQIAETLDRLLQARQNRRIEVQTRWRLTDSPYDAWLIFGLLISLLSTEWFLRRRWSMV
jgi:uncharacterized membrane protein